MFRAAEMGVYTEEMKRYLPPIQASGLKRTRLQLVRKWTSSFGLGFSNHSFDSTNFLVIITPQNWVIGTIEPLVHIICRPSAQKLS